MVDGQNDFAQELEQFFEEHDYDKPQVGDIRKGIVVSVSQQGVIVDLGLKRDGLVPANDLAKLSDKERDALKVDDEVAVYMLSVSETESLTVSLFRARIQEDWARAEEMQQSGEAFEGEIENYNKGGLLIPFGRLRGFVPMSHLSGFSRGMDDRERQRRLAKMRGETIPVKIIEVDRQRRRLVFSNREAQRVQDEEARLELMASIKEGDIIKGRVRSIRDFGAFVDLGGVDGLVHVSELAWHRVDNPHEVVKRGQEVEVQVLRIDRERQRISLSRKPLLANPWDSVEERYYEGQLVEGRIVRLVDYGAFVEIEPGVEGLLHTSQLARTHIEDPGEIVAEGETHLLRVLNVDGVRQRIRLSLRAVTAREQIEWMTQQAQAQADAEAEAETEQSEEESEAVDAPATSDEEVAEVAEVDSDTVAETVAEEAPAEDDTETSVEAAAEEAVAEDSVEEDSAETSAESVETTDEVTADEAVEEEAAETEDSSESEAAASDEAPSESEAPADDEPEQD